MMEYNLIRSKRKSIEIRILPDKKLEVRAPLFVSKSRINNFVCQKENWILKKLNEPQRKSEIPVRHFFVPGESFYYRGRQLVLKSDESPAGKNSVRIDGNTLCISTKNKTPEAFQKAFSLWQKNQATEVFSLLYDECWAHFSSYYPKFKKPILTVRAMKTRWGSLSQSSKRSAAKMTLNTFLICADNNCIKQVIYHELCHLIQMNHSNKFYEAFEFFVPDWKRLKGELEELFMK